MHIHYLKRDQVERKVTASFLNKKSGIISDLLQKDLILLH